MFRGLIAGLILLVTATASSAATIAIQEDEFGPYIMYSGSVESAVCEKWSEHGCMDVTPPDSFRIHKLLEGYPQIRRIKMSSGGGVASEGYEIGHVLRKYGVFAEVPKGAYCLSACAIAFSGAVYHEIGGVVGYHATWTTARNIMPIQAMAAGQSVATQRAKYLMIMGFHYDLMHLIANATSPSVFFVFKNTKDFRDFYVGPQDGVWGLLTPKEYGDEYFKDKFMEGKAINEYVVGQRMEQLAAARREYIDSQKEE